MRTRFWLAQPPTLVAARIGFSTVHGQSHSPGVHDVEPHREMGGPGGAEGMVAGSQQSDQDFTLELFQSHPGCFFP